MLVIFIELFHVGIWRKHARRLLHVLSRGNNIVLGEASLFRILTVKMPGLCDSDFK